jgi:2-methylcitrate dehydratase PrpD
MTPAYARLCLKFVLPLMLIDGEVNPRRFTPELFSDPEIARLSECIDIVLDGNEDPNALAPQRIEVELTDGRVFLNEIHAPLGSPDNPLTPAQRVDKVERCFRLAHAQLDPSALVAAAGNLRSLADARSSIDSCIAGERNC